MKSFFLAGYFAAAVLNSVVPNTRVLLLDTNLVNNIYIEPIDPVIVAPNELSGGDPPSCSDQAAITLDLTSFANGRKNYNDPQVTYEFTATDNTAKNCGPMFFVLSYEPPSETMGLIKTDRDHPRVTFVQSSNGNDVEKYTIKVEAHFNFPGQTCDDVWSDYCCD